MIDTELLDLINSGNAWVLIGSGVSVDAGLPSWASLVTLTLDRLASDDQKMVRKDIRFRKGKERNDFAQCFQRMQDIVGQADVIDVVKQVILTKTQEPGYLTKLLADWPAAGYLTTNYDDLLESALGISKSLGWIPVGNQQSEVRKVSGDVRDIVWHIHGSARLPDTESSLVIGSKDYDDLYLDDSPLQQQLKSFLTQRRLVLVGFGLRDPEILRLLRLAGRYTVPERPIYAFLGSKDDSQDEGDLQELRDLYNIEVKRYPIIQDTHVGLRDLLDVYSSMIVRRSVNYGQIPRPVPSYDPDTTGLLIYNSLVLQNPKGFQAEASKLLLSARILSVAKHQESVTLNDLRADVGRIATQISGETQASDAQSSEEIESIVRELEDRNLVTVDTVGHETMIRLTVAGDSFVAERTGVASRIRDQFRASLASRADQHIGENANAAAEVAITAGLFFEDCIEKRSLGVAMVLNAPDVEAREFQMVALLQALPRFFDRLSDADSARALVKVVQGILTAPSRAEAKQCGLLLQARLGVHLLGVDQNTLKSRTEALQGMTLVLDSTSLIPLLATSGTGHRAAVDLMGRIERIGAKGITTPKLLEEVREHAAYATREVTDAGGAISVGIFNKLTGKDGQGPNVFLSGFAEEYAEGSITSAKFELYMQQRCGFKSTPATIDDCDQLIRKYGVRLMQLAGVPGFVQEDYAEIEALRTQIEDRRRQSNSFRHDRQVSAEAEVVILVQKLRDKQYTVDGGTSNGVFFVSNSRFIDRLNSVGLPLTIRQDVLFHLLGTIMPFEESELPILMDGLLWELSERGIEFVDRKKLMSVFSSTISAAKEEYPKIVEQHKILIANELGEDPEHAFQEPLDDLEILTLMPRHARQTIDRQERELKRVIASSAIRQANQELSQSERRHFERLKAEKANRVNKNRKTRRRALKVRKKKRS